MWFKKIEKWFFDHFMDPEYGEILKYLRRDGTPSSYLKATRWAGAFHYPRMLFNLINVMKEELAK